ncbi:MAG: PilZ domain-containing protein [Planctomycetota bacterium]
MFEHLNHAQHEDEALVAELQRNTTANIRHEREHERFAVSAKIDALPANLSDQTAGCPGRTVDVSAGGCMSVFEAPLHVGDVYRLQIHGQNTMPELFARCLRVRMLRPGAFEAGFVFLTSVDLSVFEQLPDATPCPIPKTRAG